MFESGQLLQERYQLQQPLGRSPQARQTWLATDLATELNESVVVKLLVFTKMQWQDLKLFEREAQVLQHLKHPRIPRYRDYFLVEQQPNSHLCWSGLVQDYVPGRSLQDLLEQGTRWNLQEVRRIAEDVLQILKYLHSLSPPVLHRDIKPSNLIYYAQQIWLIDFGSVHDQAVVTGKSFTVVGTVGYAPVEQFWGRPVASSDLYALGATLIHLLTGVSPADLSQHNLRIEFRDRISSSSSFIDWIEKLIEPALENRFSSAHEASESLKCKTTSTHDQIQTVCSTESRKVQRVSPSIVVKQSTLKLLKIQIDQLSSGFSNRTILLTFYVIWGLLTCVFLPFTGLVFAFNCAFVLAYFISLGVILWQAKNTDLKHEVCFDRVSDRFEITTRSHFNRHQESGIISAIRYLSITSSQAHFARSKLRKDWVVNIRSNQVYIINWKLSEDECIWLVDEIQTWLGTKK